MKMDYEYARYAAEQTMQLLAIDSPSGFTAKAAQWVQKAFTDLGYQATLTRKGGVLVDLGGNDAENALMLEAHTDTLGGMVAEIKNDGHLRLSGIGGMNPNNAEAENVRVYTREGKVLEGTCQLCDASVHVNGEYSTTTRTFDTIEVLLDENTTSEKETRELGVEVGDIVAFEPRSRITESG